MVKFCFFWDSLRIGSKTSSDGDGAIGTAGHSVVIVLVIEFSKERAAAVLGSCKITAVRPIAARRNRRQIVCKVGDEPRDGWAPLGAGLLCNFMSYRCFFTIGERAGSLRAPKSVAQYLSGILGKKTSKKKLRTELIIGIDGARGPRLTSFEAAASKLGPQIQIYIV